MTEIRPSCPIIRSALTAITLTVVTAANGIGATPAFAINPNNGACSAACASNPQPPTNTTTQFPQYDGVLPQRLYLFSFTLPHPLGLKCGFGLIGFEPMGSGAFSIVTFVSMDMNNPGPHNALVSPHGELHSNPILAGLPRTLEPPFVMLNADVGVMARAANEGRNLGRTGYIYTVVDFSDEFHNVPSSLRAIASEAHRRGDNAPDDLQRDHYRHTEARANRALDPATNGYQSVWGAVGSIYPEQILEAHEVRTQPTLRPDY